MTPEEIRELEGPSLPSPGEVAAEQRLKKIRTERDAEKKKEPSLSDALKAVPPMIMEFIRNPQMVAKAAMPEKTEEQKAGVDAISQAAPKAEPEAAPPGRENEELGVMDDFYRIVGGAAVDGLKEMARFAYDVGYAEHMMAGISREDYMKGIDMIDVPNGEGLVENLTRDMARFFGAYGAARAAMPGVAKGVGQEVQRDMVAGAVADATMMNPEEENLSAILKENFGIDNPFINWLAEPSDDPMVQRAKNAFEGGIIGIFANTLVEGSKWGLKNRELIARRAQMGRHVPGSLKGQRGMVAWHGTPHKFPATETNPLGEFNMQRIGTGEGSQVFGHGIYLAEDQGVAGWYRTNPDDGFIAGDAADYLSTVPPEHRDDPIGYLRDVWAPGQRNRILPDEETQEFMLEAMQDPEVRKLLDEWDAAMADDADVGAMPEEVFERLWSKLAEKRSYLYEVDVPDEQIARMLDWDKPLNEQAPEVQEALRALDIGMLDNPSAWELTGGDVYKELQRYSGGDPEEISEMMKAGGIPGIRYLDGQSRGKGEGTRNMVLFDPTIATITSRNGERVPMNTPTGAAPAADAAAQAADAAPLPENLDDTGAAAAAPKAKRGEYPPEQGWAPMTVKEIGEDGKPVYKQMGWALAQTKDGTPLKGPARKGAITRAANKLSSEVRKVMDRATNGDEAAQYILKQANWYRAMRTRLREEFGGLGDLFADKLGAASPNTPVETNWHFAVDALKRFVRGDFDKQLAKLAKHLDEGGQISKFPDTDIIRQESGAQYGLNSRNLMLAMLDLWRSTGKQRGAAPKARNFSGNLIGTSDEATIDVWAARILRRMLGKDRIPPPAETGVGGTVKVDGTPGGDFGFGQDIFRKAAADLGMEPDELQAVAWFIEKELWGKNGWTNQTGGSFDEMADAAGYSRMTAGISRERPGAVPTLDEQLAGEQALKSVFRNQPNVLAYKARPTIGRFMGQDERAFDVEIVVTPKHEPAAAVSQLAALGKQYDQDSIFVSKVLRADEESPNARPGIEVYLKDKAAIEDLEPLLASMEGVDGFTFSMDLRAEGAPEGAVGVRVQWVPEFEGIAPEDFDQAAADATIRLLSIVRRIEAEHADSVSLAMLTRNDTVVINRESYDDYIAAGSGKGDPGTGVPAWFGRPGRENVAGATGNAGQAGRDQGLEADLPRGTDSNIEGRN